MESRIYKAEHSKTMAKYPPVNRQGQEYPKDRHHLPGHRAIQSQVDDRSTFNRYSRINLQRVLRQLECLGALCCFWQNKVSFSPAGINKTAAWFLLFQISKRLPILFRLFIGNHLVTDK